MLNPIYNLPEYNFVGGESQTMQFELLTPAGNHFNASDCTIAVSIVGYANKTGTAILTKDAELSADEEGLLSRVKIVLKPSDTVTLFGKYVYQLSIKSIYGEIDIPGQGIMNITRNIDQQFIHN